jgi:hypothetical protein
VFCGTGIAGTADGHCSVASFANATHMTRMGYVLYVVDSGSKTLRRVDIASGACCVVCAHDGDAHVCEGKGCPHVRLSSRVAAHDVAGTVDTLEVPLTNPSHVAASSDGVHLYVGDARAVVALDTVTGVSETLVASEVALSPTAALQRTGDCSYVDVSVPRGIVAVPTGNSDYPDTLLLADEATPSIRTVKWTHWNLAADYSTLGDGERRQIRPHHHHPNPHPTHTPLAYTHTLTLHRLEVSVAMVCGALTLLPRCRVQRRQRRVRHAGSPAASAVAGTDIGWPRSTPCRTPSRSHRHPPRRRCSSRTAAPTVCAPSTRPLVRADCERGHGRCDAAVG